MEAKYVKRVRSIETGHGTIGIQLNLSMIHVYNLCMLRDQTRMHLQMLEKYQSSNTTIDIPAAIQNVKEHLKFLDFVCQDFVHPSDPHLWDIPNGE